jgi:phage shock protein PspC (stress-responsive transcriptional regulator)
MDRAGGRGRVVAMENSTEIPAPTTTTGPRFTLRRSRTDRMLSGVCGGVAEALDVDVALARLGMVALTVISGGGAALLYLAAWILIPEADAA